MKVAGRLGDRSRCSHGGTGIAITGSGDVLFNDRPALRVGDRGRSATCCQPEWRVSAGAPHVMINGRAAHRIADSTRHGDRPGTLANGSPNVLIGDCIRPESQTRREPVAFRIIDELERPVQTDAVVIYPDGRQVTTHTDSDGRILIHDGPPGTYLLETPLGRLRFHSRRPLS